MHTLESSDLQYSAFIIAKGGRIISIDRISNPKRAVFELETSIPEKELKAEFVSNPLIRLQDFIAAQATAKKCLFSDVW